MPLQPPPPEKRYWPDGREMSPAEAFTAELVEEFGLGMLGAKTLADKQELAGQVVTAICACAGVHVGHVWLLDTLMAVALGVTEVDAAERKPARTGSSTMSEFRGQKGAIAADMVDHLLPHLEGLSQVEVIETTLECLMSLTGFMVQRFGMAFTVKAIAKNLANLREIRQRRPEL